MKFKNYCLVFIFTAAICLTALGQIEPEMSSDELLLIDKPCPNLAGIDALHIIILHSDSEPNVDGLNWAELESKVTDRLEEAGIKQIDVVSGGLNVHELRVYVNLLELAQAGRYVFFVRTAIARAVRLNDFQVPVFKTDVWHTAASMQAVSQEDLSEDIIEAVLDQVDVFLHSCPPADSNNTPPAENQKEQTDPSVQSQEVVGKYVASKNSSVFHKPDCGSATRISQDNLVIYNTREEAIAAGKRPCKSCNP
jgi:hypothetical protein